MGNAPIIFMVILRDLSVLLQATFPNERGDEFIALYQAVFVAALSKASNSCDGSGWVKRWPCP